MAIFGKKKKKRAVTKSPFSSEIQKEIMNIPYRQPEKGSFEYKTRSFQASTRYFEMNVNKARKKHGFKTTHQENKAYNSLLYQGKTPDVKRQLAKEPKYIQDSYKRFQAQYESRDYTDVKEPKSRGKLDRVFDALNIGQYAVQGAIRGSLDDKLTVKQGIIQGIKASNPFGGGHEKWEYTFSDNLERMGWTPTSKTGKASKFVAGLAGDIFLDPSTYISGGLGGLIKGSGKSSAKVALKGQKVLDAMGDSAKFIDNVGDLGKAVGMTQDMAEAVVKGSKIFKSGKHTLDVAEEGAKLMSRYNKILGINSKSASVTLSLGNAPFGKKLFGRMADKKVTLIDSDVMKTIGDSTLAPIYARARHAIVGGQIGKMFSTNHSLYKIARDKPEQVFNFIKQNDLNIGDSLDKKAMMKSIKETSEMLGGLDPATQKEVMQMMEDKTVWGKVKAQVRFVDTEEASGYVKKMEASKEALKTRTGAIDAYDAKVREIKKSTMMNVFEQQKALELLEIEHIDNITSINSKFIKDSDTFKRVNEALTKAETYFKNDAIDPDNLINRFRGTRDDFSKDVVNRVVADRPVTTIDVKDLIKPNTMSDSSFYKVRKQMTDIGFREYKNEKWANKFLEQFPDWDKTFANGSYRLTPPSSSVSNEAIDSVLGVRKNLDMQNFDIMDYYKPKDKVIKNNIPRPHKDLSIQEVRNKTKFKEEIKLSKPNYKPITKENLKNIQSKIRKDGYVEYKSEKLINGFTKEFPDWEKTRVGDKVRFTPHSLVKDVNISNTPFSKLELSSKHEFIDDLSKYIFGKEGVINKGTRVDRIEEVVSMMEKGTNIEDIAYHIFENKMDYNGANKAMYQFIADNIGYKNWNEEFTKPMEKIIKQEEAYNNAVKKLEGLRKKGDTKAVKEFVLPELPREVKMIDLRQKNLKREALKAQFKGVNSLDDVEKIIGTFNEVKFNRSIEEVMQSINDNLLRKGSASHRDSWNIEGYMDKWNSGVKRQFQKEVKSGTMEIGEDIKEELLSHLFSEYKFEPWKTNSDLNFYKHVEKEVQSRSLKYNTSIYDMDVNTRMELYKNSYNHIIRRWKSGGLEDLSKVEKIKSTIDEVKIEKTKNILSNHKLMQDSVKRNNKITFSVSGERANGIVEAVTYEGGKKVLTVEANGTYHKVRQNQVLARLGNAPPKTLDDLRDTSAMYDKFVNKQADIQDRVKKVLNGNSGVKIGNEKMYAEYNAEIYRANMRFTSSQERMNDTLIGLEKQLVEAKSKANFGYSNFIEENVKKIQDIDEALGDADAFESYVKTFFNVPQDTIDAVNLKYTPNLGDWILKPHKDTTEEAKEVVEMLTGLFEKMGSDEVAIGSLKQIQFDKMDRRYLPHVLTKEGSKMLNDTDVVKHMKNFGDDFGFGREFNQFAQSRTIKRLKIDGNWVENPNVSQINQYFNEMFPKMTKGNNLMSESLADIYLARAMKHTDFMYDNKYMNNMLDLFGEDYTGEVLEGFNTVTNYGQLKEFTRKSYALNTQLDMSDAVNAHLESNDTIRTLNAKALRLVREGKSGGKTQPQLANELITKYIGDYKRNNFPEDVRKTISQKHLKEFLKTTGTVGMLDDLATPLGQLGEAQIKGIDTAYATTSQRYLRSIQERFGKLSGIGSKENSMVYNMSIEEIKDGVSDLIKHSDAERMDRVKGLMDKVEDFMSFKPATIKNVNSAIVEKANQSRKLQIVRDNNSLLDMYDKFTHFIKLNQTAISPAFHARNKLSNMFNNWLEVGGDAVNPSFQKKVMDGMKGKISDEFLEITTQGGKKSKVTWGELLRQAEANKVIDKGVFAVETGAGSKAKGLLSKVIGDTPLSKLDPTDTSKFIGYTYGTNAGNIIENHDRFVHFVSKVKNGASFAEAGESVNKFLFDYSDLTMFEQSTMKRLMPYYTWLRKNSALQLEMLIEKPDKYRNIGKVMGGVEAMVGEEDRIEKKWLNDFAKEWVQTPFFVNNPEGNREPVLWNPNLPFQDLAELPNPFDLEDTRDNYFTKLNPMIKIPIELAMNKNVFFDNDIVKEDSESPGRDRAKHVANQFALVPIAEGFLEKKGTDLALHTLNNTSGIKLISYDYDKWKGVKQYQLRKKAEQIRSKGGTPYSKAVKRKMFK